MLVRAHIQLGGPIVAVWDNLSTHLAAGLKQYEAEHDRLATISRPPSAPDLNPGEAVWSLVRRATTNTAFDTPDGLDSVLRRELRRIHDPLPMKVLGHDLRCREPSSCGVGVPIQFCTRLAAWALSSFAWARVPGVTQTRSLAVASRHTYPDSHVGSLALTRRSAAWALSSFAWARTPGVTQT
ncbi:transposase [Streptomyces sp. NBC_00320]|uniref:transposase n=1 Tax=Streptomyces sp. NBC_00320 TaxID=2975711 RepID=UPI002B1DDA9F|nr:transposase [Streptomyces sp. NBC_00320]